PQWTLTISILYPKSLFVPLGQQAFPTGRSHSLLYNMTVLSWDGFVQSRFFAEGYLDRQAFLHYDHKKGRAEPWGQWAEKLAAETLETEYTDLNATWKELRKLLEKILSLQEEKGDDSGEGARVLWGAELGRWTVRRSSSVRSVFLERAGLGRGPHWLCAFSPQSPQP
uniref:MHC class I-like antigen recognition-like domain-containing protein n=1 Tax=Bos indicus x Bos taurus TaxID=30522 RepID=A0A4W2G1L7_BOBOX